MKLRGLIGLLAFLAPSLAVGASLLPNGQQQFFDANGAPLASGQVCLYVVGSTTPKTTWLDRGQTLANTSPCVALNSAGRTIIWGYGQYRQMVYDSSGGLIWDQVTAEYVSDVQNNSFNWGGTSGGSANVQTIVVQPAPPSYVAGQQFQFVAGFSNSGILTLNVNALGAKAVLKASSAGPVPLAGGEIVVGNVVTLEYMGNSFQLVSFVAPPQTNTALISNTSSDRTSSYTVVDGDDNSTIYLSGGVGNQTLTISTGSAYSDSKFAVRFCDVDTRRWTIASADGGNISLYPGQCNLAARDVNSMRYDHQFTRYLSPGQIIYVGQGGSCNDANDGLVDDASGEMCSITSAILRLQADFDTHGTAQPTIQLATGTYVEEATFGGSVTGGADQIDIQGDPAHDASKVKIIAPNGAGSSAVFVRDYAVLTLRDLTIGCPLPSGSGTGITASQWSVIDLANVVIGSCDGSNALLAQDGGHINGSTGGLSIEGNAASFFDVQGGGSLIAFSGSIPLACVGGPWAFSTAFLLVSNLGYFTSEGVTITPSGCAGTVGLPYFITTLGVADTGGSTLPGNVPGTVNGGPAGNGGIYQ